MRQTSIETNTYRWNESWYVDIVIDSEASSIDAWLYHSRYGIKKYMFGESWDDINKHTIQDRPEHIHTYEDFLNLVEANMGTYIKTYIDRFMV